MIAVTGFLKLDVIQSALSTSFLGISIEEERSPSLKAISQFFNCGAYQIHFKDIDIFAFDPQTNVFKSIQVKARRGKDIPIGTHKNLNKLHDRIKCPFVFVRFGEDELIEYYITLPFPSIAWIKKR